jgi:16S rRNA (cytosine967-C5)-methyltransferase
MTPGARVAAAIEVIAEIEGRRRPAADVLKDWGLGHRFAGSGDRAAIAGLVYDSLRRRASSMHMMGDASARAVVLGALRLARSLDPEAIAKIVDGSRFAPQPLTAHECARLASPQLADAPPWVLGDYPEWLDPYFLRVFGEERTSECAAMAQRAPLDLRVNTLKVELDAAESALSHLAPLRTPWSPFGLRIVRSPDDKNPAIQSEPLFLKGGIEVQDEGSQLAALLTGAKPGEQVIDLCAGAGGKTLALAAVTQNRGQVYATDTDKRRLAPIHARLERAGVHNVQVRTPKGREDVIADLNGRADLVLIDAPCTGTGTWRRNPDAKWRLRPGALAMRLKQQIELLDRAVSLLKPDGRLVYVTCSVLAEENQDQVRGFIARHPQFAAVPPADIANALDERAAAFRDAVRMSEEGILMTARRTGTDCFYVSVLRRNRTQRS